MPTRIQSLFLVRAVFSVSTGEDWCGDAIAFYESDGVTPISFDGMSILSDVRSSRESNARFLTLTTPDVSITRPAGTRRGLMLIGGVHRNVIGFYAPFAQTKKPPLPGEYVGDVVAMADGVAKMFIEYTLAITQGITR